MNLMKLLLDLATRILNFFARRSTPIPPHRDSTRTLGVWNASDLPSPLGVLPQVPKPGIDPTVAIAAQAATLKDAATAALRVADTTAQQAHARHNADGAAINAARGETLADFGNKVYESTTVPKPHTTPEN